jgi:succinoglycan biosynthesis protein ExoM
MTADAATVTIAVLTFRRPDDLAALLPLLVVQAEEAAGERHSVDVLVVDNDPAASGRAVVESIDSNRVRYVVETTPGIAAARNRALDEAGAARFLVFIDDDERPHARWLAHLLDAQDRHGSAAVAGAVVSDFAVPPEPWVADGGFFRRRRLPSGTRIDVAATNNLLLDMDVVRSVGVRFDPAFGLTGGSDTLFTRQLVSAGAVMSWCDEAVVTDWVPAARVTRDWVLRRAFRSGNSMSLVDLALAADPIGRGRARFHAARRGLPRLIGGLARWLVGGVVRSRRHQANGLRVAARGAGMLAGATGIAYAEYRRPRTDGAS